MSTLAKAEDVINSCCSYEQYRVARKFVRLAKKADPVNADIYLKMLISLARSELIALKYRK